MEKGVGGGNFIFILSVTKKTKDNFVEEKRKRVLNFIGCFNDIKVSFNSQPSAPENSRKNFFLNSLML